MRRFFLLVPALALLLLPVATFAAISNGETATDALGQYDDSLTDPQPIYMKGAVDDGPNILGMNGNDGVALDAVHHRLFVVDSQNERVLVYNLSSTNTVTSHVPSYVLGQPNFYTNAKATTQSGMDSPFTAAYDSNHNRLFVGEYDNHRVLVFDVSTITNGMNASYVLGQPTFTSSGITVATQSSLSTVAGLLYDTTHDRLFVGDDGNHRILVFSGATLSNDMNANLVLGQSSFTGSTIHNNTGASNVNSFVDMAYDPVAQHLFVADYGLNRVLVFSGDLTNGMNATYVLGQNGFTTETGATTQTGMHSPFGIAFDPTTDHLFVQDAGNNRILVFSGGSLSTGMTANAVIGQSSFTTGSSGTSQSAMNGFGTMAYDTTSNHLFAADSGNNRVLVFSGATLSNGMDATDALGQYDDSLTDPQPVYTKGAADDASNILGMNGPDELALDPVHHRLFVTDGQNNRVLVYTLSNTNTIASRIPSYVLGQPNFYSNAPATTQSGMNAPEGIAYDSNHNRLFVGEYNNHRVLVFDVSTITNGMNASYVLGQPNFTSSGTTVATQSSLSTLTGLLYDTTHDRLFVGNDGNHRILVFSGATLSNDMNATLVLGQSSFTGSTIHNNNSASNFNGFMTMAYDPVAQHLFVADYPNSRVLVFSGALTTGMNASYVLGQNGFTTETGATTQTGMKEPFGLAFDPTSDHLFVHDSGNNRILVFSGGMLSNYMPANTVIGQTSFTTGTSGTTQSTMNGLGMLAYDTTSNHLFVADSGNNRVLVFNASPVSTSSSSFSSSSSSTNAVDGGVSGGTRGAGTDFQQALGSMQQRSTAGSSSSSSASSLTSSASSVSFTDVPSSSWFASYVQSLSAKGIISGYTDANGHPLNLFKPGNDVTYAEVAKMAILAAGLTPSTAAPQNTSAQGQWSAGYIAEAETLHLSPYTSSIDVNTPMSRAAALDALLQTFQIPMQPYKAAYTDVTAATLYASAIATATNLGIVEGDTDASGKPTGAFRPDAFINRAELAKILAELIAKHGAMSSAPAH